MYPGLGMSGAMIGLGTGALMFGGLGGGFGGGFC